MKEFGKHYLVEFTGCRPDRLKFVQDVEPVFLAAAQASGATVISHTFHQFEPFGVTGIILIAESHFSIHTWPEDAYVAFDVLTCGVMDAQKAIDHLKAAFRAGGTKVQVFARGF